MIRFLCQQTAQDSCRGTQTTQDMQVDMLSSSPITTLRCLTPAPRSADGTTTTYTSAGIANTTCHVKRCQEVYRRGRESVTCAIYCDSARLHCAFGCACTHKRCHGWRGGRSKAQNHDGGHLRMSLDVPDLYLTARAPRCLCYVGPRPRPADGANGAMHTVGGHMQLEVKQGHSDTRRGVGCCLLRAGAGCRSTI